jgi:hypothetical protein
MAEAADLRLITGRPPLLTLTHEDMFPRRVSAGFFFWSSTVDLKALCMIPQYYEL